MSGLGLEEKNAYTLLAGDDSLNMDLAGINVRDKFLDERLWQVANLCTDDVFHLHRVPIVSASLLG